MQEKNKSLVIERIIRHAKWIRAIYIFGFIVIAVMVVGISVLLLEPVTGLRGTRYAVDMTTLALIFFFTVGIALMIQIYFFSYLGKVIKNSQNGQYTSATPAMVLLVLTGISIALNVMSVINGETIHLISVAIAIFTSYLTFSIYKGLKEIKDNGYFDQSVATEYAPDYTSDYQNETTNTVPEQQTTNSANQVKQDDTWIKED